MAHFMVSLERKSSKRTGDDKIEEQIKWIIDRATSGERKMWEGDFDYHPPKAGSSGPVVFRATLNFIRKKARNAENAPDTSRLNSEMIKVMEVLGKACSATKFGENHWIIKEAKPIDWKLSPEAKHAIENAGEGEKGDGGDVNNFSVGEIVDFEQALTLDDIEVPEVLIHGSDEEIENHPAFEGIFGRAPHIRVAFSSIKTMKATHGKRRNHVLFHGLPGAAKSTMFRAIQSVLGKGAYLGINANSATRAGVEAIFLDRLSLTGCPPFMFIEEIEKTLEAILTVWLSILDERREVRKVTHHAARKADVNVLCFATANDKLLFDRLMGGRPGHPGALSSRFNKPLYVARPTRDQMRKILLRDINLYGGDTKWVEPCIGIADEVKETDPRIILGYLDGAERLLTGEYKEDIIAIRQAEEDDKKRHRQEFAAAEAAEAAEDAVAT